MDRAVEELAAAVSSGTAAIEKLATELQNSISELKNERTKAEDARATQVTTCEEEKKALQDSQGNVISAFNSEIAQLNQEKKDAEDNLEAIKMKHEVADEPVAAAPAANEPVADERVAA